uniref:Uncharacterized protein n=1 Tax=Falco tinnunculus TaxID=100819 RepID=A0A8C4VDR4_FALTI
YIHCCYLAHLKQRPNACSFLILSPCSWNKLLQTYVLSGDASSPKPQGWCLGSFTAKACHSSAAVWCQHRQAASGLRVSLALLDSTERQECASSAKQQTQDHCILLLTKPLLCTLLYYKPLPCHLLGCWCSRFRTGLRNFV